MINNHKLYSITLVSTYFVFMLVNIAGAAPYAYVANSVSSNLSVINTTTNTVTATVPLDNSSNVIGQFIEKLAPILTYRALLT